MIPLVGGVAFGLVWGWLLAQRFAQPLRLPAAGLATAAVAAEAALLAGAGTALVLLAAAVGGGLLRAWLSRAIVQRAVPA